MTQSSAPRLRFTTNHWSIGSNGDESNCPVIQHPTQWSLICHQTLYTQLLILNFITLCACCANPLDTTYIGEAISHELHPISPTMGHSGLNSNAFSPPSLMQSVKWIHLHTSTPTGHVQHDTSNNSKGPVPHLRKHSNFKGSHKSQLAL
ncbi:hypothetical protein O181_008462 [Austropuccinia psidii MF-1]|uniref:Uncharacterized protein n=1 Tax=Austropuccinia psidii MF-1 TaxID=1389203 RepID=A0A9Q3GJE7_9BASI|nr:hypothetical protein [Austropuccinia psidii MF-1]